MSANGADRYHQKYNEQEYQTTKIIKNRTVKQTEKGRAIISRS